MVRKKGKAGKKAGRGKVLPMASKKRGAKGAAADEKPKRARNVALPGMEDAFDAEIERDAIDYEEARDARMKKTEIEVEKKTRLIATLKNKGVKIYRRGELEVVLVAEKETVKVRRKEDRAPAEDGGQ